MYLKIRSELNCAIVREFRKHNIEIPFPQRDLHLRSPENIGIKSMAKTNN
jgi:small-conductance mechanosensitive channel